MFLEKTVKRNKTLIDEAIRLHGENRILPDTYVVDLDTLLDNAKKMLDLAKEKNIKLLFMLKQLGRNPYIAKKLVELGYEGAVVVDFNEAKVMMDNKIPIGNVGNLVQIPEAMVEEIVEYGVGVITVFSIDKLKTINRAAKKAGKVQRVILRVYSDNDTMYPGQEAGISIENLKGFIEETRHLDNIKIVGITSFPAFLYDEEKGKIFKEKNYETIFTAKKELEKLGLEIEHINLPSATCIKNIEDNFRGENLVGEPGHGLSGTTPMHAVYDLEERPCVIYLSEISHNFKGKSYAYGGGYYRRSHVKNCLVFENKKEIQDQVLKMDDESIDYYFQLKNEHKVGSPVIMAFRFQIFVTRSKLALLENLEGACKIVGLYDSLGKELK